MQTLHYAREVLRNHNLDADQTATGGEWHSRLGGFRQFVHNHEIRRPIVLKIGFQFPELLSFAEYYEEREDDWSEESMFLDLSPHTGSPWN